MNDSFEVRRDTLSPLLTPIDPGEKFRPRRTGWSFLSDRWTDYSLLRQPSTLKEVVDLFLLSATNDANNDDQCNCIWLNKGCFIVPLPISLQNLRAGVEKYDLPEFLRIVLPSPTDPHDFVHTWLCVHAATAEDAVKGAERLLGLDGSGYCVDIYHEDDLTLFDELQLARLLQLPGIEHTFSE